MRIHIVVILILFGLCCMNEIHAPQDAILSSCGVKEITMYTDTQSVYFSMSSDTEFVEICAYSDDIPTGPVSLMSEDPTIQIYAVQFDGCIEPVDGAFDDLILQANMIYKISVLQPIDYVSITFNCNI